MFPTIGPSLRHVSGCVLGLACILVFGTSEAKNRFRELYAFRGGSEGAFPEAGLVRDNSGTFYGTTYSGGNYNLGTVFRLSPDGSERTLYSFDWNYGANPQASLILDRLGNLFGTTVYGDGAGNIFELTPSGQESVLYAFTGGNDGAYPASGLLADKTGNLYGSNPGFYCDAPCGAVYKLAPDGKLTVLHTFSYSDKGGVIAFAVLIADKKGNLYGTDAYGGKNSCGCGVVYAIPSRGGERVLHIFSGAPNDGASPLAGVIADSSSNLYGTTASGGAQGMGTVFKLTRDGAMTLLHSFGGNDGDYPAAALIADESGDLYGTTMNGGPQNLGVVFELAPDGSETLLHTFRGEKDGATPLASLIADDKGNLYGTTASGGAYNAGVVFEIEK